VANGYGGRGRKGRAGRRRCRSIRRMATKAAGFVTPEARAESVKQRAAQLGFGAAGITDLSPVPHAESLTKWLDAGMAGTMGYMQRQAASRREPSRIVPGATRAVVVSRNYFRPDPSPAGAGGLVAKYARGRDYHLALKRP